ncbi:MAG TPA: hypothetical protein GX739_04670 [Firmicutes bacterium]|nr:hypothetical protein [Bacillota bacterium]
MKNLRPIIIVLLALLFSGCARLGLKEAKVELLPEQTILTITLTNKGTPIRLLPLEAKIMDQSGNEYAALDYTGNLMDPMGKNHGDSVSGTIIFPPLDSQTTRVKIDLVTLMISKDRRYFSRIAGDVENGLSDNLTFKR